MNQGRPEASSEDEIEELEYAATQPPKTPAKVLSGQTASNPKSAVKGSPRLTQHTGVPEPKHPGKTTKAASLSANAGELLAMNAKVLQAMQVTGEAQINLAKQQFAASETRYTRKLTLEERQFEMQEKHLEKEMVLKEREIAVKEKQAAEANMETRVQEARRLLADPSTPEDLKDVAKQLVIQYLTPSV